MVGMLRIKSIEIYLNEELDSVEKKQAKLWQLNFFKVLYFSFAFVFMVIRLTYSFLDDKLDNAPFEVADIVFLTIFPIAFIVVHCYIFVGGLRFIQILDEQRLMNKKRALIFISVIFALDIVHYARYGIAVAHITEKMSNPSVKGCS